MSRICRHFLQEGKVRYTVSTAVQLVSNILCSSVGVYLQRVIVVVV